MEKQIWKYIPGYTGVYLASESGEIKNAKTNRILKQFLHGKLKKYLCVGLATNGKSKTFLVHRLIISTFNGLSDLHIDHIDGNTKNNHIKNLRYCTQRENNIFSREKLGRNFPVGVRKHSDHKRSKPFQAYIKINGKQKSLGYFPNIEMASETYRRAIKNV